MRTGGRTRNRPGALAYLWHHRHGRLALGAVLVGLLGLTLHYWTAVPMLLALRLPRGRQLWS